MTVTPSNLLTQWARLLIGGLAQAGVRDVVLSPGSRSTPFAWAALRHPGLRCHSILDERSAAFFAVGQGRIADRPSLLVCTSGSAGAHYLPALVEAAEAGVPVVALTADRPFELHDCSAPQTVDQTRLFGGHARFVELGLPDARHEALSALLRRAGQAVHASAYPSPGPVHLNAPARKPLEPTGAATPEASHLEQLVTHLLDRGATVPHPPRALPAPRGLAPILEACRSARRGLIVCGPLPPGAPQLHAVTDLAEATGFPLLCEAASQLRLRPGSPAARFDAFDLLLQSDRFRAAAVPDVVLQLGAPPSSDGYDRYVSEHAGARRYVVAARGWPDPQSSATGLLLAEPGEAAAELARTLGALPRHLIEERAAWSAALERANAVAWEHVDAELAAAAGLEEGSAIRALCGSLPAGGLLAVGNSLPIRELDTFVRAGTADVLVLSQRGANGIDGLVSGAAGAALASGRPTALLVGDLGFLHDLSGLWAARRVDRPLVLVVLDNDGGRIFEQLPLASLPEAARYMDAWLIPHGLDLTHAGRLFDIPTHRAEDEATLRATLARAFDTRGCSLVVVGVPRQGAARLRKRLKERLDHALAPLAASL